ncbi:hypothetical protein BOTNAR_0576g00060 [Botryotinia narcissicola]|uniref:Uncharacterized protein n=1 Tax=Botryotinia narcissicola TaxID=278944 RepID=A0A4Z1HIM0_9HELO|nr:hypothetical protein BOTNAR_0576g00060 [Botryotinia narcissicola]
MRFLHFAKDPMVVLKRAYEGISFAPDPHRQSNAVMYPWQSDYRDPAHLSTAKIETAFQYSDFGIFENEVRQLKFYMDSQKPRGFRQLWRDKRDALNYYTSWGVIIFGASTLFLAIVSLAVSAAQAVAAFKALDMPPSSH